MYYLNRNGTQTGPFNEAQLQHMAATGQISPGDFIWKEGDPEWLVARDVLSFPASGPPPVPPPPVANPYSPAGNYRPPAANIYRGPGQEVPNYLVQSILATLLCCLPFGIPAIVYAASVSGKTQAGDYAGAKVASDKAKFWCWMSFWFGLGPILIVIFTGGLGGLLSR